MKTSLLSVLLLITSSVALAQSITLTPVDPANPDKGTLLFDNATNLLKYWNGIVWIPITNAASVTGWAANGTHIYNANEGNVGVGTNNPVAPFNVGPNKTVLFGADTSSSGMKFIWYSTKGALRAGGIYSSAELDYANIGINSIALGNSVIASGAASVAFGGSNEASGNFSTAMGNGTTASAHASTAIGNLSSASGHSSTAMGTNTVASGTNSTAGGFGAKAIGNTSVSFGLLTKVSSDYAAAFGKYNVDVADAIFMVGRGDHANLANALTIMKNGNIGIGNNNPIAPLHISGSKQINETNNRYFSYATGTDIIGLANGTYHAGLVVDYNIVTGNNFISSQSYTSSDARIKNIIGLSDNKQDLNRLQQIRVTNYHYKDLVNRGSQVYKKVIAQQVEEVYPEAVNKITSILPDIYSLAEKTIYDADTKQLSITLAKNYDLKAGDKIKLVHPTEGEVITEIESVADNTFTVKNWNYSTEKLFVYGREVNDFRVVDYEALSMLGISAIQQLAKELEELKKQSSEMEELKKQNKALKADFTARLEALESRLMK